MFKNRSGRNGFTLPEVLVTVAIVAVLAAVVVPAVTQQLGKGDAPAFVSSMNSMRTAITSFAADVRQLPGEVSQLGTAMVHVFDMSPGTFHVVASAAPGAISASTSKVPNRRV